MKFFYKIFATVCCLLFSILANFCWADKITISVAAPNIPPYVKLSDSGQISGILVNKLKRVEQQHQVNFNIYIMPWARALKEVSNGRIDALMPTMYTDERAKSIVYPKEIFHKFHENVLLQLKADKVVHNVSDISENAIIAKMRSMALTKSCQQLIQQKKAAIVEAVSMQKVIELLLAGKVDYAISDKNIAMKTIETEHLSNNILVFEFSNNFYPSYLAFSPEFAATHDINQIMSWVNQP